MPTVTVTWLRDTQPRWRLQPIAPLTPSVHSTAQPERPAALVPMYAAFGVVQAMDAHSTYLALRDGTWSEILSWRPWAIVRRRWWRSRRRRWWGLSR